TPFFAFYYNISMRSAFSAHSQNRRAHIAEAACVPRRDGGGQAAASEGMDGWMEPLESKREEETQTDRVHRVREESAHAIEAAMRGSTLFCRLEDGTLASARRECCCCDGGGGKSSLGSSRKKEILQL